MTIMMHADRLSGAKDAILDLFYPVKCCSCGEITPYDEEICSDCRKRLEYIDLDKRCKFCGSEKRECTCATYVHRYKEMLSVFKYEGVAKRILLRFKMLKKPGYHIFLAKEMALYIVQAYRDYKFDCICFVPISRQSYLKREFNQSLLIAKALSKILKIKLNSSLYIKHNRKLQHRSKNRLERLYNSRYKYGCKDNLSGKTVLLIDDVATTGATLDDCTRALLFAGAKEVYCAVAMITCKSEKGKEKGDKNVS